MRTGNNRNFFWASYADLMTALFVVMLTLFVLHYDKSKDVIESLDKSNAQILDLKGSLENQDSLVENFQEEIREYQRREGELKKREDSIRIRLEQSKKLERLDKALSIFSRSGYFSVDNCQRNVISKSYQPKFEYNSATIPAGYRSGLLRVGRELLRLIKQIKADDASIEYMIVIEGSAGRYETEEDNNIYASGAAEISYKRALALFNLWRSRYKEFEDMEVMINGSGLFGGCRVSDADGANRRFVVQVIPKLTRL